MVLHINPEDGMTYREAHAALRQSNPTTYPALKAEAIRLAGGYVQGLKLLHELAGMGAYTLSPDLSVVVS